MEEKSRRSTHVEYVAERVFKKESMRNKKEKAEVPLAE